ncbi:GNAT family N-acetyltransferase [Helcococcus kunzii]|uniref:GNAT family N-acetyltransferase n=1 Tax=Helcococcus kunzii TaxID=40091 RepID=UPI0024ACB5D8|nr:GNAT family N-acetyltransferase [Helcococcus kunzii]
MTFISFKNSKNKQKLLDFLEEAEWPAGPYLAKLIKENDFYEKYGDQAQLFFYIEKNEPLAFGGLVEQDYLPKPDLKPWIALIYVDPKSRGQRLSEKMVTYLEKQAKDQGYNKVYLVSRHKGLYEKYGYRLQEELRDIKHDKDYFYIKSLM